ncbi:hypothetical protein KIPB_006547, partial [Kipferlia bialata]
VNLSRVYNADVAARAARKERGEAEPEVAEEASDSD